MSSEFPCQDAHPRAAMQLDFAEMENEDLYALCLRGDQGAWAHVYGYVLSIARWPRWNLRETPEDTAQSIILFLLEAGIHKVQQPAAFRGFVKRVAVNKILDSFKKANPGMVSIHPSEDGEEKHVEPQCSDPGPEEVLSGDNLFHTLRRLLDELPEYCRKTVPGYFRYRLGLIESYKELSDTLGAPVGTISAQVRRCLDVLSQHPDLQQWL